MQIRVFRLDKTHIPELELTHTGHTGFVTGVGFDTWGTRLASTGNDGALVSVSCVSVS